MVCLTLHPSSQIQTIMGACYSLLDKNSLHSVWIPSYFIYLITGVFILLPCISALLWHRLMGKTVLATNHFGSPYLRTYTHCSKQKVNVKLQNLCHCNSPFHHEALIIVLLICSLASQCLSLTCQTPLPLMFLSPMTKTSTHIITEWLLMVQIKEKSIIWPQKMATSRVMWYCWMELLCSLQVLKTFLHWVQWLLILLPRSESPLIQ